MTQVDTNFIFGVRLPQKGTNRRPLSQFCEKVHFFVHRLSKTDISEENKRPRIKMMKTKIIENKISHLMMKVTGQFPRYFSVELKIIGNGWEKVGKQMNFLIPKVLL